jgi:hypothetical protein
MMLSNRSCASGEAGFGRSHDKNNKEKSITNEVRPITLVGFLDIFYFFIAANVIIKFFSAAGVIGVS